MQVIIKNYLSFFSLCSENVKSHILLQHKKARKISVRWSPHWLCFFYTEKKKKVSLEKSWLLYHLFGRQHLPNISKQEMVRRNHFMWFLTLFFLLIMRIFTLAQKIIKKERERETVTEAPRRPDTGLPVKWFNPIDSTKQCLSNFPHNLFWSIPFLKLHLYILFWLKFSGSTLVNILRFIIDRILYLRWSMPHELELVRTHLIFKYLVMNAEINISTSVAVCISFVNLFPHSRLIERDQGWPIGSRATFLSSGLGKGLDL